MMRTLPRILVFFLALAIVGGAWVVGQSAKPGGVKMAEAATKFLTSLSDDEKKTSMFTYDDPHRTTWYFTPQQDKDKNPTRLGLRLEKLTEKQKELVLDLLRTGLSANGYKQADAIMANEGLLAELEGKTGANTRNPNWYFISIFGQPNDTGKWGWRLEGHHLSINFTLEKGEVISSTPLLFGTNPAEVKTGAKIGQRTLSEIEDVAKKLIATLSEDQNKAAKLAKQLPEILEKQPSANIGDPLGIPATKLSDEQAKILMKLVEAYADRLPGDIAEAEMKRVEQAGPGKIYFAYCVEADKPGQPWTYRVHGPTFVVEFLNVQADASKNPANHIHSGWRTLPQDFGLKTK
jgi:hypothetical protein